MITVQEIEGELAALEAQAQQMIANSNAIQGAKQVYQALLNKLKAAEAKVVAEVGAAEATVEKVESDL